ncbi:MAG: Ku protein [Acidobacteriota bacterium]
MARPYWNGQIRISLVSFGVHLFVATEAKSDIHFHQVDRHSGERVRHQKVLASALDKAPEDAADPVEKSQIVKGYEYAKGRYVTIEPEELAHLRVPSKHTMDVTQFVDESEIDPEYYEKPYFVVPENDAALEAFATVRQALLDTKKIALSKIAFAGREHVVALSAAGTESHGGLMAYTLRYAAELRDPADYFTSLKKADVSADSIALAKELIKRKSSPFDPEKFVDGYEAAVKELVEAKLKHAPIPKDEAPAKTKGKVINLMDALRASVHPDSASAKAKPTKSTPAKKSAPHRGLALVKSTKSNSAKSKPAAHKRKTA